VSRKINSLNKIKANYAGWISMASKLITYLFFSVYVRCGEFFYAAGQMAHWENSSSYRNGQGYSPPPVRTNPPPP
jgi:hypothetical protein